MRKPSDLPTSKQPAIRQCRSQILISIFLFFAAFVATPLARGQTNQWIGGTGDWDVGTNWSLGSPSGDNFAIENGGTAQLSSATSEWEYGTIGTLSGTGTLGVQSGGSLSFQIVNSYLYVGRDGTGTMSIATGGSVTNSIGRIGDEPGSNGNVTIGGGTWENTEFLNVGFGGNGSLTVTLGLVSAPQSLIGSGEESVSQVVMNGGTWSNTGNLTVGLFGQGSMTIEDTATVSNNVALIGVETGSTGIVTVNGGAWNNSGALLLGQQGSGELVIHGGIVRAAAVVMNDLGAPQSVLHLNGGVLETAAVDRVGAASLHFNGGTLRLTANESNLFQGFTPGEVSFDGAATVDTQAFDVATAYVLNGNGGLTKQGSGTLTLTSANTYAGGTTIENGVVAINGGSVLGSGAIALDTGELRATTDLTLLGDAISGIPEISVRPNQAGTFSATTGTTFTLSPHEFVLGADATLQIGSFGNTGTVVFSPGGSVNLPSTAAVAVEFGTLRAGNNSLGVILSTAVSTTVATGATLEFNDLLPNVSLNTLLGGGTVNIGTDSNTVLTVQSGNFSGTLAGAGKLVKDSTGTLILSGNNNLTQTTTINAGTLVVDGSTGNVDIQTGGTLGGTGSLGTINLLGGTLAPGNSPGNLTADELVWDGGILSFELGPDAASSDSITLTGDLIGVGSSYAFTFGDNGWETATTYDLISFSSSLIDISDFGYTNGGDFAGVFAYDGNTLQFTLTAIPEPSTMLLLIGAAGIAFWLRRRSR